MEKKRYKVAVTEVYRKVVTVLASNEHEALQRVDDGWMNGELILSDDDFSGMEVCALDQGNGEEALQKIESKE